MARLLLVEFDSPEALSGAVRALAGQGFTHIEAYSPYSTEVVREALGRPRSRLPVAIFVAGILGSGGAYFLQWYLVGYLYPLNVGGRPPHMPLAFVPITFEMGVLLAAFTAFFGVLVSGRLLKLHDPVFEARGFESVSSDKFWLSVDDRDPRFDTDEVLKAVESFGPKEHSVVEVKR